jgi:curved DNA-binding protein CbpA
VDPRVTSAEIKKAYRALVKSCHPDLGHNGQTHAQKKEMTEQMMRLNEAYETLMDKVKRSKYDVRMGIRTATLTYVQTSTLQDEDEAREIYLRTVFHPARQSIGKALTAYKKELHDLSLDIYDDQLLAQFEKYVDHLEEALREGSDSLAANPAPRTLDAAARMMRYSIAQAADGLDELRRFLQNFDYDHLSMAENLFRIALDLSRQAYKLIR